MSACSTVNTCFLRRLMSSNKVLALLKSCLGHDTERAVMHKEKSNLVVYIPSNRAMNSSVSSNGSSSNNRAHFNRRHLHKQAVSTNQTDPRLELPPFIPLSEDGEEGYSNSQKQLPVKQFCHQTYECFRPPNRTICGRESPPTYRSNLYSQIDKENGKGPTRIVKNSNGDVTHYVRCYTMGNNNDYSLSRSAAVENRARRTAGHSTVSCDVNRNPSISGDPPPYSEAVAESNPAVFTRGSTGSI